MTSRQASRKEWATDDDNGATIEQIKCGSLQRIADAVELMGGNWSAVLAERDRYARSYREEHAVVVRHVRDIVRLKRQIEKLKRKLTREAGGQH